MEQSGNCPICNEPDVESSPSMGRNTYYRCKRCGEFRLTSTASSLIGDLLRIQQNGQTLLSYSVRKMQGHELPTLNHRTIEAILKNSSLPSLKEQENNLILYMGNESKPGEEFGMESRFIIAVVGSLDLPGLTFVINHLRESEFLTGEMSSRLYHLRLTMKGWERYEEIRRGNIDSKKAFMAMPFGDQTIDEVYKHFKAAVAQTGFDLRRIDEEPKAGLIDDRLRVEINTSRFLIADLTNENRGAYWEAGFAEGLGRPVIYTCEKAHFEEASTHFDTNHHLTVQWELDKIDEALDDLKATIRVTLPGEAKLEDD